MSDEAERAFDELTDWVVRELTRVRGDHAAERAVLEEAVRRYAATRRMVDPDEPWSYVTHFLNADGVAFERARQPAFGRVRGVTPTDASRWCEFAAACATRLESEAFEDDPSW